MSAVDTSESSDNEAPEMEAEYHVSASSPPPPTSTTPSHPPSAKTNVQVQTSASSSPGATTPTSPTAKGGVQPPAAASILSPLLYQTPQGMMYATPSNGGVLFSLAPQEPGQGPQFIIPLSVMATANGQGELDLSKRKWPAQGALTSPSSGDGGHPPAPYFLFRLQWTTGVRALRVFRVFVYRTAPLCASAAVHENWPPRPLRVRNFVRYPSCNAREVSLCVLTSAPNVV